jgi:hypothetical protein
MSIRDRQKRMQKGNTRGKGRFAVCCGTGTRQNSFFEAVKCPIKMDAIEGDETERVAHLDALLGNRPSTIQSYLPCLQRLQMFSPEGK